MRVPPRDSQSTWLNINFSLNLNLDNDVEPLAFRRLVNDPLAREPLASEHAGLGYYDKSPHAKSPRVSAMAAKIGWRELFIFLVVLLAHFALLALLSWQFKGPYLVKGSIKQDKKAISAYMLTQAEFDAMKVNSRPAEVSAKAPLTSQLSQREPKQDTLNQRVKVKEDNLAPVPAQQSIALTELNSEKEASATQVTRIQPNVVQTSVEPSVAAEVESIVDPSESGIAPKIESPADTQKEKEAFSFEAVKGLNLEGGSADSGAVSATTGDYMARHRQAQLDKLVEHAADKATQKQSMSEMDGEMRVLALPKEKEYETAITLDSKLDPNRIEKIGDTCYRVVSVATPINPHGENLGFPFKCGGDKVKQAIKDSLDKHLSMMGVEIKDKN